MANENSNDRSFLAIKLDYASTDPLYRQLYERLRGTILSGRLAPNSQLPSTRALAADLGVSRNTVVNAFDQLLAEGYLRGRTGSGTFVTDLLPEQILHAKVPRSAHSTHNGGKAQAAAGPAKADTYSGVRAFQAGLPAIDSFPFKLWGQLIARRWRKASASLLDYGEAAGYGPLREAIASYLESARGVQCQPEQVIIVAGSQQALDLTARVLLEPHSAVWIEDPGYLGARDALMGARARLIPVPVDDEGLMVDTGIELEAAARAVYVTPARQFPLGMTMSLARRLKLLEWARHANAWVLEDDYDSQYRYTGRPLTALQGIDQYGRVIYIGTFSKVIFPGLRLGYIVVPPELIDRFVAARKRADQHSPLLEQAVVTDFINDGHFSRHIRRMRALYAERQAVLVEMSQRELHGLLEVEPASAGMHLVGWLPRNGRRASRIDDRLAEARAAEFKIETQAVSSYRIVASKQGGLILGYAAIDERKIRQGVRQLAAALASLKSRSSR